jgi:two-component system, NtrC family, response regulator AtoC
MAQLSTQPPAPHPRFQLLVRMGQKSDVVVVHDSRVLGIGRSGDNTIQLNDVAVSRQHAALHPKGEVVEVEDLGSANGTVLIRAPSPLKGEHETQRLVPHQRLPMRVGDALRVGSAVIALQPTQATPHLSQSQLKAGRTLTGPHVLLDPAMRQAYELVERAAQSDISILILGETGVGKEVMAETVHRRSHRMDARFLLLNCAALPENLLESELFGHEKGAFTGAHITKTGLLEATDGGTVFLDEIGELPMGTQAKLLRVLEERMVMRLGATKPRPINVRFVTATNRDLARQVRGGLFRSDLYYRISGLVVRIPPLRQRPTEIEPLARFFLRKFCENMRRSEPAITAAAVGALQGYNWPGNVRELRNVIERAILIADQGTIDQEHVLLDPHIDDDLRSSSEFNQPTQVRQVFVPPVNGAPESDGGEKARIIEALESCGGNQTRAAQILGISRRTLINRLDKWNLPRPKKR